MSVQSVVNLFINEKLKFMELNQIKNEKVTYGYLKTDLRNLVEKNPACFELSGDNLLFRPKLKVCKEYIIGEICTQEDTCCNLHICYDFIFGLCTSNRCIAGHYFKTQHNTKILEKCYLSKIREDKLHSFFLDTLISKEKFENLTLCSNYDKSDCENETCFNLHICSYYLLEASLHIVKNEILSEEINALNCQINGKKCLRSHYIFSGHNKRVFVVHNIHFSIKTTTPQQMISNILKYKNVKSYLDKLCPIKSEKTLDKKKTQIQSHKGYITTGVNDKLQYSKETSLANNINSTTAKSTVNSAMHTRYNHKGNRNAGQVCGSIYSSVLENNNVVVRKTSPLKSGSNLFLKTNQRDTYSNSKTTKHTLINNKNCRLSSNSSFNYNKWLNAGSSPDKKVQQFIKNSEFLRQFIDHDKSAGIQNSDLKSHSQSNILSLKNCSVDVNDHSDTFLFTQPSNNLSSDDISDPLLQPDVEHKDVSAVLSKKEDLTSIISKKYFVGNEQMDHFKSKDNQALLVSKIRESLETDVKSSTNISEIVNEDLSNMEIKADNKIPASCNSKNITNITALKIKEINNALLKSNHNSFAESLHCDESIEKVDDSYVQCPFIHPDEMKPLINSITLSEDLSNCNNILDSKITILNVNDNLAVTNPSLIAKSTISNASLKTTVNLNIPDPISSNLKISKLANVEVLQNNKKQPFEKNNYHTENVKAVISDVNNHSSGYENQPLGNTKQLFRKTKDYMENVAAVVTFVSEQSGGYEKLPLRCKDVTENDNAMVSIVDDQPRNSFESDDVVSIVSDQFGDNGMQPLLLTNDTTKNFSALASVVSDQFGDKEMQPLLIANDTTKKNSALDFVVSEPSNIGKYDCFVCSDVYCYSLNNQISSSTEIQESKTTLALPEKICEPDINSNLKIYPEASCFLEAGATNSPDYIGFLKKNDANTCNEIKDCNSLHNVSQFKSGIFTHQDSIAYLKGIVISNQPTVHSSLESFNTEISRNDPPSKNYENALLNLQNIDNNIKVNDDIDRKEINYKFSEYNSEVGKNKNVNIENKPSINVKPFVSFEATKSPCNNGSYEIPATGLVSALLLVGSNQKLNNDSIFSSVTSKCLETDKLQLNLNALEIVADDSDFSEYHVKNNSDETYDVVTNNNHTDRPDESQKISDASLCKNGAFGFHKTISPNEPSKGQSWPAYSSLGINTSSAQKSHEMPHCKIESECYDGRAMKQFFASDASSINYQHNLQKYQNGSFPSYHLKPQYPIMNEYIPLYSSANELCTGASVVSSAELQINSQNRVPSFTARGNYDHSNFCFMPSYSENFIEEGPTTTLSAEQGLNISIVGSQLKDVLNLSPENICSGRPNVNSCIKPIFPVIEYFNSQEAAASIEAPHLNLNKYTDRSPSMLGSADATLSHIANTSMTHNQTTSITSINTRTVWSHELLGNVSIAEICYKSVESLCEGEIRYCPRLHSALHFHWQVCGNNKNWYNLPREIVILLERAFCNVHVVEIKLTRLDPAHHIHGNAKDLFLLLGRFTWTADFTKMEITNSYNKRLVIRRLCTEFVNEQFLSENTYLWYFLNSNKEWIEYGQNDYSRFKRTRSTITSVDIENHFHKSPFQLLLFHTNTCQYYISFPDFCQVNKHTLSKKIIRRRPKLHLKDFSTVTVDAPLDKQKLFIKIGLKYDHKKYILIEKKYWDKRLPFVILEIERVKNSFLWVAFEKRFQDMKSVEGCKVSVNFQVHRSDSEGSTLGCIPSAGIDWRLYTCDIDPIFKNDNVQPMPSPYAKVARQSCRNSPYKCILLAKVAIQQLYRKHHLTAQPLMKCFSFRPAVNEVNNTLECEDNQDKAEFCIITVADFLNSFDL